jgi:hypothetical protein
MILKSPSMMAVISSIKMGSWKTPRAKRAPVMPSQNTKLNLKAR